MKMAYKFVLFMKIKAYLNSETLIGIIILDYVKIMKFTVNIISNFLNIMEYCVKTAYKCILFMKVNP